MFLQLLISLISISEFCSQTDTQSTVHVNALLELVSLTEKTCGFIKWCTIQTERKSDRMYDYVQGCCTSCSCTSNCVQLKTCCPDYKLQHKFHGMVFSNVSRFISEIGRTENVTIKDIQMVYEDPKVSVHNIKTECVRSSLFDVSRQRPKPLLYRMVISCQRNTENDDLKQKCENYEDVSTNKSISNFIPVQSLDSGVVYRNIYCLECSDEASARIVEWDTFLTCFGVQNDILQNQIASLRDLFIHMVRVKDYNYMCDLQFKPSVTVRESHPPAVCTNIDVNTCKRDSITNIDDDVAAACQKLLLPVYTEINGSFTTFKNLACLPCNGLSDTHNVCTAYYKWQMITPFIGKISFQYYDANAEILHDMDYEDPVSTPSKQCEAGYIYDTHMVKCRKLYCPCGMFEYNGKCEPLLGEIMGSVYEIYITIKSLKVNKVDPKQEFTQKLFTYLKQSFEGKSKFRAIYISLWEASVTSDGKEEYFSYLRFTAQVEGVTFLDAVSLVSQSFRGWKGMHADSVLNVNMSLTNTIHFERQAVDIISERKYSLVQKFQTVDYEEMEYIMVVTITECNFCYRINLLPVDIHTRSRKFTVTRIGKILLSNAIYKMASNATGRVVCVENVIVPPHGTTKPKAMKEPGTVGGVTKDKRVEDVHATEENWYKHNALLLVVISLVVILSLTCMVKRRLNRTVQSNGPVPDQTEMVNYIS